MAPAATRKLDVWLLIGSGVVASAQIGKAIIAMPMIRADLALGYGLAGLIVGTFATLGAAFGIGAGVAVQRIGLRTSLVGGMGTIAVGNAIGAAAPNEFALLVARFVEGVGFFGVLLAIPSMLSRIVARRDRDFVMAVWPAYMPTGIMLMLLLGPLLPTIGWRALWLASALATAIVAVLLALCAPLKRVQEKWGSGFRLDARQYKSSEQDGDAKTSHPAPASEEPNAQGRLLAETAGVVGDPCCLILAFAFFAYSCQIFSLVFALPLLFTSEHGATLGAAGLLGAAVLAVSAIGHVASGFTLRAGVPIWVDVAVAFGFFAVTGFAIYGGVLPPAIIAPAAALALGVGGLAPGALYAATPYAAPSPRAVPPTIGLLQQASNLGQFVGPAVLGLWVEHFGWRAAPGIVVPMALVGIAAAFAIRGAMLPRMTPGRPDWRASRS